jgi:hypothetical protein
MTYVNESETEPLALALRECEMWRQRAEKAEARVAQLEARVSALGFGLWQSEASFAELVVYRPGYTDALTYRGKVSFLVPGRVSFVGGPYKFDGKWPEEKIARSFPSDWCEIEWLDERGLSLGEAEVRT